MSTSRREFIKKASIATGLLAASMLIPKWTFAKEEHEMEEVSAVEDLMREHGILERLLLIYETAVTRLQGNQPVDPNIIHEAAGWMRRFIEDYHGKLEEEYVFPAFRKANRLVEMVNTLEKQHQVGYKLTDQVLAISIGKNWQDPDRQNTLIRAMQDSIVMFRPHAAQEDTVLFPAFKEVISPKVYQELGEQFEEKEHQLFGEGGFQTVVNHVAELEKQLGIHELSQFTAKVGS